MSALDVVHITHTYFAQNNLTDATQAEKLQLYYHYQPVNGLPVAIAVMFFLLSCYTAYKIIRSPINWHHKYYLYILSGTCLAESAAYIAREVTIYNVNIADYVVMLLCILLSPNALALVNYMTVGKIIGYAQLQDTWIRPKFIPWFFFCADILCFAIQGAAGMYHKPYVRTPANHILMCCCVYYIHIQVVC